MVMRRPSAVSSKVLDVQGNQLGATEGAGKADKQ
jgi:hypothetical protein